MTQTSTASPTLLKATIPNISSIKTPECEILRRKKEKERRVMMSLSLIQGYSSAEEEELENNHHDYANSSDEDDDEEKNNRKNDPNSRFPTTYNPVIAPQSSDGSVLPSALDAFSEVAGPPKFLNNCVEDQSAVRISVVHHRGRHRSRDKKDLPAGAVVEAKAQLVGMHERVRSDIEGSAPTASGHPQKAPSATTTSSQPSMCLQCGIPKIYSSALGMVCPVCPSADAKKKGSTVKDKEKSKRMKGQSSHASWKSETEMQLRQTFD